ncbi:MAG: hypothetical protein EZS28_018513 [Streblomastix strix]|uniref:Uncharacterized protein n=1 Tax=Streblomastix strix TaxID=222440 RepID=A0A5J4VTJ4_9EUKA|nr:MAG: hypothetical protein EZS28_018513 [Streblomastix strix]
MIETEQEIEEEDNKDFETQQSDDSESDSDERIIEEYVNTAVVQSNSPFVTQRLGAVKQNPIHRSAVQSASRLVILILSSQKQFDSDNDQDELINTGYKAVHILLTSWKGESALSIGGCQLLYSLTQSQTKAKNMESLKLIQPIVPLICINLTDSDRIVRQGTYFCFRKLLPLLITKEIHSLQSEFNLCLSTQFQSDLNLSSNDSKIILDDIYKTIAQFFSKDIPELMMNTFIPTLTRVLGKNSSTLIQQSQPSELHYSPTLQLTSNAKIQSCLLLGSLLREVPNELKGSKAEQKQISHQSSQYSIQNQASVFKQNIQDNILLENTIGSNIEIPDDRIETDLLQHQASLEHQRRQLLMNAIRAIIGLLNDDSKHVKASASRALGWL